MEQYFGYDNAFVKAKIYLSIAQMYVAYTLSTASYSGWGPAPFDIPRFHALWPKSQPPTSTWWSPLNDTDGYSHMTQDPTAPDVRACQPMRGLLSIHVLRQWAAEL